MMLQKFKEKLQAARERVTLEEFTTTVVIALASYGLIPAQGGLTYLIREVSKEIPAESLAMFAIAFLGLATAASIVVETKTLKEKGYSASPIATGWNANSGRSLEASTIGHVSNLLQSYGLNPANWLAIATGMAGRSYVESSIGTAALLGLWCIAFNTLILKDKAEPVVEGIRRFFDFVKNTSQRVSNSIRKNKNP